MNKCLGIGMVLACWLLSAPARADGPQDELLQTILAVNEANPGDPAVAAAWRQVSRWELTRLSDVMNALDRAHPVARNWLRAAIDGMLESNGAEVPSALLQSIAVDSTRGVPSRQVALELLESVDPQLVESLVPRFLNDPAEAFRRPAVAQLMTQAEALASDQAQRKELLLTAFRAARAEDQVTALAKSLAEMGEAVDVASHFGFVMTWQVVGPFENKEMAGFDHAYPPESLTLADFELDGTPRQDTEFTGVDGPVRWQQVEVKPGTGEVDLNEVLGKLKGVLAYGAAVVHSEQARPVELRLRLQNPYRVWVNGQLVQSQRVGHTGNSFDQYRVPVELRAGANLIIVKSCQPEPPQANEWYDTWHWSVRVCDATGTAILERN